MNKLLDAELDDPSLGRRLLVGQICHGTLGGSTRVACRLANALSKRGHGVHMFSYEVPPWTLNPDIERHACRGERHDDSRSGSFYRDWTDIDRNDFALMLKERLLGQSLDVLHFHYALPFAGILRQVALGLSDRMPVTVGTLHGTDLTSCLEDTSALASLDRDLAAAGDLTTVSGFMYGLSHRLLPERPAPRVIPNFVEDDWPWTGQPDGEATCPRKGAEGKPVFLHISNFRAVKDVDLLARLFLRIYEKNEAELWLVGDGPELPALRTMLDGSPAKAAVRYFGVCPDPAMYFQQATFFLSTSNQESFGLAVLEAMASGLAVVATAVGGVPELMEDDVSGILFEPRAVERTASRVLSLLDAPVKLDKMRAAALRQAARLRESRVVGQYEDLYSETAERARRKWRAPV